MSYANARSAEHTSGVRQYQSTLRAAQQAAWDYGGKVDVVDSQFI